MVERVGSRPAPKEEGQEEAGWYGFRVVGNAGGFHTSGPGIACWGRSVLEVARVIKQPRKKEEEWCVKISLWVSGPIRYVA